MYANEEMCLCYGRTPHRLCRMCRCWEREFCQRTNRKRKCPAWGMACGKFEENEDVTLQYGA